MESDATFFIPPRGATQFQKKLFSDLSVCTINKFGIHNKSSCRQFIFGPWFAENLDYAGLTIITAKPGLMKFNAV